MNFISINNIDKLIKKAYSDNIYRLYNKNELIDEGGSLEYTWKSLHHELRNEDRSYGSELQSFIKPSDVIEEELKYNDIIHPLYNDDEDMYDTRNYIIKTETAH